MQHPEEGVIKFHCEHILSNPLPDNLLAELKHFRQLLYMQKLIGVDEFGVGYGNISMRFPNSDKFIITGTQTGHLPTLSAGSFTLVDEYNIKANWLKCQGPIKASSESLTHAALYLADPQINTVIHIHHAETWEKYLFKLPTTPADIAYGSPEIAMAIANLCREIKTPYAVLLMGGHKDGIIIYARALTTAYQQLQKIIELKQKIHKAEKPLKINL